MAAPRKVNGKTHEQWDRMCRDKRRYADEFAARAGAMNVMNNPNFDSDKVPHMWVYQCPNCRGWHMTKSANDSPAVSTTDLYVEKDAIREYYRDRVRLRARRNSALAGR